MTEQKHKCVPLTIFTPAYNRAHTLGRTYESLLRQGCKEFVWLIVDDGSTDNTAELVRQWQARENGFEIRYLYKENGGMHTAHNVAYAHIDTELNTCIDSDDALAEDAVEKILNKWEAVRDGGYAGIMGLDADLQTGQVIGAGFPANMQESTVSGYYNGGGSGDKKLVYRTELIKQYPEYPVFPGEKYVSLSYKYLLIDQSYKMAVLDEVLCLVDYQPDGSTHTMYAQYLKNPQGFAFWRKVRMEHDVTLKRCVMDCIHYVAESRIGKNKNYLVESPKKLLTFLCIPAGVLLERLIKQKNACTNDGKIGRNSNE